MRRRSAIPPPDCPSTSVAWRGRMSEFERNCYLQRCPMRHSLHFVSLECLVELLGSLWRWVARACPYHPAAPEAWRFACGHPAENLPCNAQGCPADCIYSWQLWTTCSKSCGTGVQSRHLTITQLATFGGRNCPAAQTRTCNTQMCPTSSPTATPTASPTATPTAAPTLILVKPVLNVFGLDPVQLEASTNSTLFYDDPGATCTDSIENDISDDVDVRGAVYPDYSKPGKYELKYVCTNSAGDSSD